MLRGARLYVALFPCNECAKAIIQSGIREIIYFSDKYAETANIRASKRMLDAAGVRYHPLQTGALHHTGFPRAGKRRDPAEKRRGRKIILYFSVILCYDITAGNFAGTSTRSVLETAPEESFRPPGLSRWIIF